MLRIVLRPYQAGRIKLNAASGQIMSLTRALTCAVRAATVKRETKETKVEASINLDGTGVCSSSSQIPFLDHMMDVSPSPTLMSQGLQCAW